MSAAERARDYAEAVFEALFERAAGAIEAAADALERDAALARCIEAAGPDEAEPRAALDNVLPADIDPPVRNLCYVLQQHGDLRLLPEVASALRRRASRAEAETVLVQVVTALPLEEDQRRELEQRLQETYGGALAYSYRVDAGIVGGMIVHVGDRLIDGSVAARLKAMRASLGLTDREQART